MSKKVLLISYHFPPSAEVGGLRIANFASRLPLFGWQPYVLTLKDQYVEKTDPNRLDRLGEIHIAKAGRLPTLSDAYLWIKRCAQRRLQNSVDFGPQQSPTLRTSRSAKSEGFVRKFRRYVLSFLTLPDPQRNWIWPAVLQAVRLIKREQIGVILTSCPPYSAHIVGLIVKQLTGTPWIADFRDPWMATSTKSLYCTCVVSRRIEQWLEQCVIRQADVIISNTQTLNDSFVDRYRTMAPDRFVCITNGFDGDVFSKLERVEKEKRFTITYTGTLYFGRTPEPVFHAVQQLIREGSVRPEDIHIRLVGHCQLIDGRPIEDVIERYQLRALVEVLQPVSYMKSIELVKHSHLALLLAPNQPYQIPAKVYDYIAAGTRVLALAEEGATWDLIRSTGVGGVFHPTDVAGIKRMIASSIDDSHHSGNGLDDESKGRFDVTNLTGRLVDQLDRIGAGVQGANHTSRIAGCPSGKLQQEAGERELKRR